MDKYLIYEVAICTKDGGGWHQLFIGFPSEVETLHAICLALKLLTDALRDDPEQVRILGNTYGNYSQLIREQGLPNKPAANPNGDTTKTYTYVGVTVGFIKARVLGHAYDTKGAQDDN